MTMTNYEHVMLDLETMGNKSNAAIVSIGAVEFNIKNGKTGDEYYRRVDLQSCIDLGMRIDASTLYWWMKQDDDARLEMAMGGDVLFNILGDLNLWFQHRRNRNFKLWGNGARFDIGLLEDAYTLSGWKEMPWDFRNERDLRTLAAFAPEIKQEVLHNTDGPKHNPIFDCKLQIEYASRIWNKFNLND